MIGHSGPCDYERGGEQKCVACRAREPLTAETITDAQIRALREQAERNFAAYGLDISRRVFEICNVALFDRHSVGADERRMKARAHLAEVLNARHEVK